MKVYALVGKSGTGKSFQATYLCGQMNIEYIIDDGLLIGRAAVLAGISAKRQKTKIGAVKTALFTDDTHMREVRDKLSEISPARILVIGTSRDMVFKICRRLGLEEPEIIINIEDITELVKLENMRKDFVANVSHELKTPLTSITGFVETLKINDDIDKNTRNHFLDIIEKESNRLKGLIEDILLLSSIENGQDLSYEKVKLFDVFKEVCEITEYIASSKNITISYNFEVTLNPPNCT